MPEQENVQWDGGRLALAYPWRNINRNRHKKNKDDIRFEIAKLREPKMSTDRLKYTGTGVESPYRCREPGEGKKKKERRDRNHGR